MSAQKSLPSSLSKGGELFCVPPLKDSCFSPFEKGDPRGFDGFSKS